MPDRSLSISARDVAAIAAAVESEVSGLAGGVANVNAVVDAIVGRAAMGANERIGGYGKDIVSAINARNQFEGITKAGGVDRYSKGNPPDRATIEAVKARLGEIAQVGQVPLAPDFGNPAKSSRARGLETKTAALAAPGGFHQYGIDKGTKERLSQAGITGPGLAVSLSFGKGVNAPAPNYDTPSEKTGKRVDVSAVPQVDVPAPAPPGPLGGFGNIDRLSVSVPGTPDPAETMPGPSYPDVTASLYGEVRAPEVPATPDPMRTMDGPTFPGMTEGMYTQPAKDISVPGVPDVAQPDVQNYGPTNSEAPQGGFHTGTGPTAEDAARAAQDAQNQRDYETRKAEYDRQNAEYDKAMAAYDAATKNFSATSRYTNDVMNAPVGAIGMSGLNAFGFDLPTGMKVSAPAPEKVAAPTKPTAPTPPVAAYASAPPPAKPVSGLANVSVADEIAGVRPDQPAPGPYADYATSMEAMNAIGAGQAPAPKGVGAYDAKTAFGDSVYAGNSYNNVMDAVAKQGAFDARKGIGEGFMDDVGIPKEYQTNITDGLMGAAKGAITGGLPGAAIGAITGATGIDKKVDQALGIDKLEGKIGAALGLDKLDNLDRNLGGFVSGLFGGGTTGGGITVSDGNGGTRAADGLDAMSNPDIAGAMYGGGSVGESFGNDPSKDGGSRYQ